MKKPPKLLARKPEATKKPKAKMLVFGKPGVGKTWFSLEFPSVYYIDTEGGARLSHYMEKLDKAGGVYLGIEEGSTDFDVLIDQVKALATQPHNHKTLIIDSLSEIYNSSIAKEADKLGDKNAFGADKKPAVSAMRQLLYWIKLLDMNVLLIAHEKPEYGLNEKGQRDVVGVTFDCMDRLDHALDLCINVVKQGGMRRARVTKSRLQEFPENMMFDWKYAEFSRLYGEESIQSEVKQVVLASDEQLAEVNHLLNVVKLDSEITQDKYIENNRENLADLEQAVVAKIITHLKSKLNKE